MFDVEETIIDSFESFVLQFQEYKIFFISESEIKLINTKTNHIFKINRETFIDSMFNLQPKDEAINLNHNVHLLNVQNNRQGKNEDAEYDEVYNSDNEYERELNDRNFKAEENVGGKQLNLVKKVTNFMDIGEEKVRLIISYKLIQSLHASLL